jgi:hypothetical protein
MAIAVTLLDEEITDAVAAVTPDAPTYSLPGLNYESLSLQANFTYGSGGTTAKAWVQTTFDQGATWVDIANFAFTTSSGRRLYHLTPVAVNGLLGSNLRVKLTTTGTYAGETSLVITALVR